MESGCDLEQCDYLGHHGQRQRDRLGIGDHLGTNTSWSSAIIWGTNVVWTDPQSWADAIIWGTDTIGQSNGSAIIWGTTSGMNARNTAWQNLSSGSSTTAKSQ